MRSSTVDLPLDLTAEEADLGFAPERLPTGDDALVARLPRGLLIVKTRVEGVVRYAICHGYSPIYADAYSLDELRVRLGLSRAG